MPGSRVWESQGDGAQQQAPPSVEWKSSSRDLWEAQKANPEGARNCPGQAWGKGSRSCPGKGAGTAARGAARILHLPLGTSRPSHDLTTVTLCHHLLRVLHCPELAGLGHQHPGFAGSRFAGPCLSQSLLLSKIKKAKLFSGELVAVYTPTQEAGGPNLNPQYLYFLKIKVYILSSLNLNFCRRYCDRHAEAMLSFCKQRSPGSWRCRPQGPPSGAIGPCCGGKLGGLCASTSEHMKKGPFGKNLVCFPACIAV